MGGRLHGTAGLENMARTETGAYVRRFDLPDRFRAELHDLLYRPWFAAARDVRRRHWPRGTYDDVNVDRLIARLRKLRRLQLGVLFLWCHDMPMKQIARTLRTNPTRCRKILSRIQNAAPT